MSTVNVYSVEKIDEILDGTVSGATIVDGELALQKVDGSEVVVGDVLTELPDASLTVKGVVELATDAETIAGTDGNRAVTPLGLASLVVNASATTKGIVELATTGETTTGTDTVRAVTPAGVKAVADTLQPLDTDLTTIAAIAKTNDNVLQVKGGVWVERTMAQLVADLAATGELADILLYNGSSYLDVDAKIYIGPSDPGSVANGSIWFDTTGA